MDLHAYLTAAADEATRVVRGIGPDQLTLPTPCRDWDVRAELDHLLWVTHLSERAALRGAGGPPGAVADPAGAFAGRAAAVVAAWARPGALDGGTRFGGDDEVPATLAASLTLVDLVVHGWDLARATGHEFRCAAEVAAAVYE